MSRKNTDSSTKRNDIVNKMVPYILVAVMLVSGFNTLSALKNYREAKKEYTGLQQYVAPSTTVTAEAESTSEEADTDNEVEEVVVKPDIPAMDIDFDSLLEINEDFKGWLIFPALELSYPVLQGTDNEHYLHETYEHNRNKAGAIFMDSYNYPDFKDLNTFIYGHNMRDGSMFGSLKTLAEHPELIEQEPYIYVYTPRASYQFQIVAYYTTHKKSDTYQFILDLKEYDAYLDYIGSVNDMEDIPDVDMSEHPRMMTLSTCKGSAGTSNRFVVHSVLVDVKKNE
ncbi:MAG: class B sortase [Lachnospiraceae bacterium]|nr:class B sortase [Lachnospiraceae bacterium]